MIKQINIQVADDMVPLGMRMPERPPVELCGANCPGRTDISAELSLRDVPFTNLGCLGICAANQRLDEGVYARLTTGDGVVEVAIK